MNLFELIDHSVVISPQALGIKEFKALWDRDKKKDKRRAIGELSYVFFICDYKSVYRKYSAGERHNLILEDVSLPDTWEVDDKVKEAVDKYLELHYTSSMRMLDATEAACEKLRQYFETVDLTAVDDHGKPIHNAKDLRANIEAIPKIIQAMKKIREEVEKELSESSYIRGGGEIGIFEDPSREVA